MIKKFFTLLCLCTLCIGSAWGATYSLKKVSSVSAGNMYVFEQSGHVMINTVSSSALQTTSTYSQYNLTGTENYVWIIGTKTTGSTSGYTFKNSKDSRYINNSTSTGISLSETAASIWDISFDSNGIALISNKSNSDRFLGYTNESSYAYKAYAKDNLGSYSHAITVYQLVEGSSKTLSSIEVSDTPNKTTYNAGEEFDPAGLKVMGTYEGQTDSEEITSGITWTFDPDPLTAGITSVSVTATVSGITSDVYIVNGLTVTAALPKITIDGNAEGITTDDETQSITINDIEFEGKFKGYDSESLWFTSGSGFIYNKESFGKIKKITINYKSGGSSSAHQYIRLGNEVLDSYAKESTNGIKYETSTGGTSNTYDVVGDYEYFNISIDNKNLQASSIVITYEEDKNPTIEVDVEEIEFEQKELDGTVTDSKTITATGKNLTAAISASMKAGSDAVFSVTPVSTPTAAAGEFTVSYSTTEAGEYTGTVVLASGETSIEIPVSASVVAHIPVLQSIAVSGTPDKMEYIEGEAFETAGLVVTGTYDVGEPQVITEGIEWTVTPSGALAANVTSVSVVATVGGKTSEAYEVTGLTVTEIPYIFYESFDTNEGTGGNDNLWSGSIASSNINSDNTGWTFSNEGGANKCAKFGTGSKKGTATTPALGYAGDIVISFKAAAWNGGSEKTTLKISASVGTISTSSVTLVKGEWSRYYIKVTGAQATTKITFEGYQASDSRFFLDEVMIVKANASKEISISDAGWATVCLPFKATITSDNATAYYVTDTNEAALIKSDASVIPAGEGVLLKSNDGREATVTFTISDEDADAATGNMMKGAITETTFDESGYKYYILANGDNGLGFYYQGTSNDGSTVTCAAGKAVLAVPEAAGAKAFFSLDDGPTGIESLTPALSEGKGVYNLNGMKVNNSYKGIVIVNGKKYMNK